MIGVLYVILISQSYFYFIRPVLRGFFSERRAWEKGFKQGALSVENAVVKLESSLEGLNAYVQIKQHYREDK